MDNKPKFGLEQYPAGTDIVQQGDVPDRFYIITNGMVEIVVQAADGQERVIDRMSEGSYFGEIGLLKNRRRVATVRAQTDVQVMAMGHESFERWLRSSLFSREEIDFVMQERLSRLGEMDLIDEPEEVEANVVATAVPLPTDSPDVTPTANQQTFATGDTIIRQGDPADYFYIIVEGVVDVFYEEADGSITRMAWLDSGNYFGEIGLLEGSPRTASVRAVTPVKVLTFDRETFGRWLAQAPGSYTELLRTATERRDNTRPLTPPEEE
jgi:cAMP-dependent protein kinase regulator